MNYTDQARQSHTALRLRMLSGCWGSDLDDYISAHIAADRQSAWGEASRAVNFLRSVVQQLSVLYDDPPIVTHADTEDLSAFAGLFHLHQKHEEYVIGTRESAIRVGWQEETALGPRQLTVRLVTADNLLIEDTPQAPGNPAYIRERRKRYNPETAKTDYYWDVWDIRDPATPLFRIISEGRSPIDWTPVFAPELVGAYPFRDSQNRPFLPWVLYHARDTGQLFDPYAWDELPAATLAVGLYYTMFAHAMKDASWVQKYALDADLQHLRSEGQGGTLRNSITVDPSSILLFKSSGDGNGSLGSFPLPAKPVELIEAIKSYQISVLEALNLGKFDAQATTVQSGVAIQIKRDLVRQISSAFHPQFRRGDTELLSVAARLWNLFSGQTSLPESGYQIQYTGLPPSQEEMTQGLDRNLKLVAEGFMSKIDLMISLNPGMDREQALSRLLDIERENALLAPTQTTPQGE